MGKIGTYEYPDTQFGTLLKAVEILYTKFKGKANDEKTFAEALGHKTNKSGGFLMKLADLRKYGLIEKRGISITQKAKDIFIFIKPETKKQALNDAIMEIRLWKELYERLETTSPSSEDFKLQLAELTSDTEKVVSQCSNIRNLYIDAMNYFTVNSDNPTDDVQKPKFDNNLTGKPKSTNNEEQVPENLIALKSGEINITLPRSDDNIKIIKSILDGMLETEKNEVL